MNQPLVWAQAPAAAEVAAAAAFDAEGGVDLALAAVGQQASVAEAPVAQEHIPDPQTLPKGLQQGDFGLVPLAQGGPRYQWSRRVGGKTVTVALSAEQFACLKQAIANQRKVELLLRRMHELTLAHMWQHLPSTSHRKPLSKKTLGINQLTFCSYPDVLYGVGSF